MATLPMNDRYRTDRIVELDRFVNVGEAMAVKNLLEHNDIRAVIDGEAMAGLFGTYMGPNIAGVRVRVFESDLQQARELVAREWEEADDFSDDDSPETDEPPNDEPNLEHSTAAGAEFLGTEQNIPGPSPFDHENPYAPSQVDRLDGEAASLAVDPSGSAAIDDDNLPAELLRARRAALLGFILFPVFLQLYSLWVLFSNGYLHPPASDHSHVRTTLLLDFIGLGIYCVFIVLVTRL